MRKAAMHEPKHCLQSLRIPLLPMKKYLSLLPASALLLGACTSGSATSTDLQDQLKNPLYAEYYYDTLVEHMVNLVLQNDPLTKDPAANDVIEDTRVNGLKKAHEATEKQSKGLIGTIVSDFDYAVGEALLLGNVLYVGPEFQTSPGADLHVYLSSALDPRDATFPDETALDLGMIKSAFGAHTYDVPAQEADAPEFRSMVLFDTKLKRIYGFAQLQARS